MRAARRGAWIGLFVTVLVDPAAGGRLPAAHRPVPRRHLRRGRDHPLRRALGAPMTKSPIAARPAEPFADVKARAAAAVEAARDELLDLSHRIHANPEPAFEEHQAAAWCRGGRRPPRVRRGASRRQPGDGRPGPDHGRQGRGRAADRRPGRVRRAAGPGSRLRPQHDGRVRASAPPSPWPRPATTGRARSCSWARRPRSGGAARRSCSATACSRASTPRSSTTPATATTSSARRWRPRTW